MPSNTDHIQVLIYIPLILMNFQYVCCPDPKIFRTAKSNTTVGLFAVDILKIFLL